MINHISAVHHYEKYKWEKKLCLNKQIYDYDAKYKELLLLSVYNIYSDELDF